MEWNSCHIPIFYLFVNYTMSTQTAIETGLEVAGGIIDGAVGNSIETGVDGYKSYQDFQSGNDAMGIVDGGLAVYHGVMTGVDAATGQWW